VALRVGAAQRDAIHQVGRLGRGERWLACLHQHQRAQLAVRHLQPRKKVAKSSRWGFRVGDTRPFRHAHKFPSTRLFPVPEATRTTLWFGSRPSFKGHSLSHRAKPLPIRDFSLRCTHLAEVLADGRLELCTITPGKPGTPQVRWDHGSANPLRNMTPIRIVGIRAERLFMGRTPQPLPRRQHHHVAARRFARLAALHALQRRRRRTELSVRLKAGEASPW
jgi:hypothetical protein